MRACSLSRREILASRSKVTSEFDQSSVNLAHLIEQFAHSNTPVVSYEHNTSRPASIGRTARHNDNLAALRGRAPP